MLLGLFKIWGLSKLGIKTQDIIIAFDFQNINLNRYYRFGEKEVKLLDVICNKGVHTIYFITMGILLSSNIYSWKSKLLVGCLQIAVTQILHGLSFKSKIIALVMFSSCSRISDTNLRWWIEIHITAWTAITIIIAQIFQIRLCDVKSFPNVNFDYFWTIPLAIGPTLSEIGNLVFGKNKYQYLNSITHSTNDKSIEGSTACFVGTFLSIVIICIVYGLSFDWYIMGLFVSTVTTALDVLSPRPIANFFIMLGNVIVMLAWSQML